MEEKPESIPQPDSPQPAPPQPDPPQPDRRSHPRFGTDDPATLLVLNHGSTLSARILDLGLGGCRLQLPKGTRISCPARLEVSFRINGIALRLSGCSQWTDGRQTVGVRFGEMSSRRKDELIALLAEIEADQEAKAAKEAVDEARSKDSATEAPARRLHGSPRPSPGPLSHCLRPALPWCSSLPARRFLSQSSSMGDRKGRAPRRRSRPLYSAPFWDRPPRSHRDCCLCARLYHPFRRNQIPPKAGSRSSQPRRRPPLVKFA